MKYMRESLVMIYPMEEASSIALMEILFKEYGREGIFNKPFENLENINGKFTSFFQPFLLFKIN